MTVDIGKNYLHVIVNIDEKLDRTFLFSIKNLQVLHYKILFYIKKRRKKIVNLLSVQETGIEWRETSTEHMQGEKESCINGCWSEGERKMAGDKKM